MSRATRQQQTPNLPSRHSSPRCPASRASGSKPTLVNLAMRDNVRAHALARVAELGHALGEQRENVRLLDAVVHVEVVRQLLGFTEVLVQREAFSEVSARCDL